MSNKGSSTSFVCKIKSTIISRLSLISFTFLVIFFLISCKSGSNTAMKSNILISIDSIRENHIGHMGAIKRMDSTVDLCDNDSVIIQYEYFTTRDCFFNYFQFVSLPTDTILNYKTRLNKNDKFIRRMDTIPVLRKCITYYNNIILNWNVNDSLEMSNYTVIKNLKLTKY